MKTIEQSGKGVEWEKAIIRRLGRFETYIPPNITSIKQIKYLDKGFLYKCIKAEGYGK